MKKTLFITCFALLLIGSILLGTWYFFHMVQLKRDHVVEIRKQIALTEERQRQIKTIEKLLDDIAKEKTTVDNVFIDEHSLVLFIETLESLARQSGVALAVENASLPAGPQSAGPEFQIRFEGSFGQVYQYLKLLERVPFQINFTATNIIKNTERGDPGIKGEWRGTASLSLLSFIKGN